MANAEIVILGDKEIQQKLAMAPKAFSRNFRRQFYHEGNKFVGNKKKDGSFRKELQNQAHRYETRAWKPYVAEAFTREVVGDSLARGMYLRMGVKPNRLEKMPFLMALAEGATITPKNANWLIIPNYENMRSVGLWGRLGGHGKMTFARKFREWADSGNIDAVSGNNGKMYFYGYFPERWGFGKGSGSHFSRHMGMLHHKLLFTGVKRAVIKKRFDFIGRFNARQSGIVKRANNMVNRTIRAIERGRIEMA